MYDHLTVKLALEWASVWHQSQTRKYPGNGIPYISHPAGVANILARHGFDSDVVAAGALHDVIEDCEILESTLEILFNAKIASLVVKCSESDKSLSWHERKDAYMNAFAKKEWEAQAIAIADKIDNFNSILVHEQYYLHYQSPWASFKFGKEEQLKLYDRMSHILLNLKPHPIIEEYFDVLERVRLV